MYTTNLKGRKAFLIGVFRLWLLGHCTYISFNYIDRMYICEHCICHIIQLNAHLTICNFMTQTLQFFQKTYLHLVMTSYIKCLNTFPFFIAVKTTTTTHTGNYIGSLTFARSSAGILGCIWARGVRLFDGFAMGNNACTC